jgi:hypothetical protein
LGSLLTLMVFIAANSGALLLALAHLAGRSLSSVLGIGFGSIAALLLVAWRMARWRTYLPIFWAIALCAIGWYMASGAHDDRRVVLGAAALALCEVGIVAAIATVFASFSSPFLTAVFTVGVFIVGRSADTLARLPNRVFGEFIAALGQALSKIVPNLMLYVPPRPLLTGESTGAPLEQYVLSASVHAAAWALGLLALASLIFRRRDFQ